MASIINVTQNNSGVSTTNTISVSISVSGSNSILFFSVTANKGSGLGGMTCSATCNSVSMTLIGSEVSSQYAIYTFYTLNPGAGNCVATTSLTCDSIIGFINFLNNAYQLGQPDDSYHTSITMPNTTSYTLTANLNTNYVDDWLLVIACASSSSPYPLGISSAGGTWTLTGLRTTGNIIAASSLHNVDEIKGSVPASIIFTNPYSPSVYGQAISFMAVAFRRSANQYNSTNTNDSMMNSVRRYAYLNSGTQPLYAPIISIRSKTSPFGIINSTLNYIKTTLLGSVLPILNNEKSDPIYFRIYNDFDGLKNIADALNVNVTTWDGYSISASMAVASQQWLHVQQSGFGEGSSGGALLYQYDGEDRPIGGNSDTSLDYSSDGNATTSEIRSSSQFWGAGFVEFKSYIFPAEGATGQLNNFVISVTYQYSL